MDRVKLQVSLREGRGTKDAKALRAAGEIPGVIYSATSDTQAITVNARALRQAVSHHGMHAILDVTLDGDGKGRPVLIKDVQLDPVRGRVVHIDLHEIRLDQKIQTVIPVQLEGHAEGVNMGGALNQPVHEVRVEALPADLIDFISVDVSAPRDRAVDPALRHPGPDRHHVHRRPREHGARKHRGAGVRGGSQERGRARGRGRGGGRSGGGCRGWRRGRGSGAGRGRATLPAATSRPATKTSE